MTRTPRTTVATAFLVASCVLVGIGSRASQGSTADESAPRVGFAEEFDSFEGWEPESNWPYPDRDPFDQVTAEDGVVTLKTHCGALDHRMVRTDWPEWPEQPYPGFTTVSRTYDVEVDFDRYHYLVVRLPMKGTFSGLGISGAWTKVCYTAGLHAQDLKSLGLRGRQQVRLTLHFLNTSGSVAFDYVKLVSELTAEEQSALISEGLDLPEEGLSGHPYHRLEALDRRADGPTRQGVSEWVVFRDVGTGAVIWKMTDLPADESSTTFNGDGSAFFIRGRHPGGLDVFRYRMGDYVHWEEGLPDPQPRFSSSQPSKLLYIENHWLQERSQAHRRLGVVLRDIETGEREEIASFETEERWVVNELSTPSDTAKMLFGHRETPVTFLVDPEEPDPSKRVTRIELPTRLKGVSLLREGTLIRWHNCYTYEGWQMDLATGEVRLAHSPQAGGHSAGGENFIVGPYGGAMKILFPRDLGPVDEATADSIRVFGNYRKPLRTDYGGLTSDDRWVCTNGVGEDVAGQHLLISAEDPGTVLHLCFYNTSRNDWPTNTYSAASPDYTKLAYVSDQLGDGDVYFVLTRLPDPPRQLTVTRRDDANLLRWKPSDRSRETSRYAIYRSRESGRPCQLIAATGTTDFADATGQPGDFYLVAAREHSGLEGHFSNEASASPTGPRRLHFEGELGDLGKPMRQVFDGRCSGYRYVRVTPVTEDEDRGTVRWSIPELDPSPWWVWGRVKARGQPGAFAFTTGESVAALEVPAGGTWSWQRSADPLSAVGRLLLAGSRTPGLCLDKLILTDDREYVPEGLDDRVATPPPAPSHFRVTGTTANRIDLAWDGDVSGQVAYYSVYVGEDEGFQPGNETVLCSSKEPKASDVGLSPNGTYRYQVVAYDWRGNASQPAALTATTADAQKVLQALDASQASLDQGLTTVGPEGESYVVLPEGVEDGGTVRWATFAFEAPEGEYMLWARYAPGNTGNLSVQLELDGQPLGTWQMRAPYRPMSRALTGGRADRLVFADKVRWGPADDVLALAAGEHQLRVAFDPSLGAEGHWLRKLYLTNDFAFRPEGWDPRMDFKKALRR